MTWLVSTSISCFRLTIRTLNYITSTKFLYRPVAYISNTTLPAATSKRMSSSKPTDIMQALKSAMESGLAQHRGDEYHASRPQDYHHASQDGSWTSVSSVKRGIKPAISPPLNPKRIRLISWNIDVLVPHGEHRLRAALQHLERIVTSSPPESAIVIFLQEMSPSDLSQIRSAPWIASHFNITDLDHRNWLSPLYGTTALVDRRLSISFVFRVPFVSKFDRDGLFIDIALTNPSSGPDDKVLRLCNVHLESLVADPPVRPTQLASAASVLKAPEVAATLLAGDLNAIQPFDRTLHADNGLRDAYLELGGKEDSDEGYTWGQQIPGWMREKFGCSRMDKILFRGEVECRGFERIGMGVKVDEDVLAGVEKDIEGGWVTDHYGVMGDFELGEGWELGVSSGEEAKKEASSL